MTLLRSGVTVNFMKKISLYIVLVLIWCNAAVSDIAFTCESIISSNQKWNFSFIKIDDDKTWVKIQGDYPIKTDGYGSNWSDKKYAEEKDRKLFWYEVVKDTEFKKIENLHIDSKNEQGSALVLHVLAPPNNDVNYLSIIIFFNADYKKEELNELEKRYIGAKNEPDKDVYSFIPWEFFFDAAHNFYSARFVWGQESWKKGNWANLSRAICK